LDDIRKIAFQNLDEATWLVSKNSIRYFESSGKDADPMTYKVYEYYKTNFEGSNEQWNEQN